MTKNKWLAFVGVFVAFNANAEHCPSVENIFHIAGQYGAAPNWVGIAYDPSAGDIVSFREALVYNLQPMRFQKCTYNTERGFVDLYPFNSLDAKISIEPYIEHWPRVQGFWFDAFICTGDPRNCQFDYTGE